MHKILLTATILLFTGCGSVSTSPQGSVDNTPTATITTDNATQQTTYQSYFINPDECDQIVDKEYLVICYDYTYKAARSVGYTLFGDLVNDTNIQDRPAFYEEPTITQEYRASSSDYSSSGYDRGHLAPDAAFDWSQKSLESTYSLANIIPQAPIVNQQIWQKVEAYAREMAVELGTVSVMNIIKYSASHHTIGTNHIAVSVGYYKVLYNADKSYSECFYYANDLTLTSDGDTIDKHQIDCATVSY
jgi:endonuclease G, mitochondrial